MEHLGDEFHLGRVVRKIVGEFESGLVETLLERSAFGSFKTQSPSEHVPIDEAHGDVEV